MSFTTTATLTIKNDDDFRRVSEFVTPDESDTAPQTDEEYGQVINFVDTLQGPERCAWMTKHCTRLYVDFDKRDDKLELSWSGRNEIGGWAVEIAELVVAQFPDIEFRVRSFCEGGDFRFGLSENGKVRWLELSDEVCEMLDFGIDVNPYLGPTEENRKELQREKKEYKKFREQERLETAEKSLNTSEENAEFIMDGPDLPF